MHFRTGITCQVKTTIPLSQRPPIGRGCTDDWWPSTIQRQHLMLPIIIVKATKRSESCQCRFQRVGFFSLGPTHRQSTMDRLCHGDVDVQQRPASFCSHKNCFDCGSYTRARLGRLWQTYQVGARVRQRLDLAAARQCYRPLKFAVHVIQQAAAQAAGRDRHGDR